MEEPTGASTELVYIPDHPERMVHALPSQDWSKPRLTALVRAIGEGIQTMEDTLFDLLIGGAFPAATGATLDLWGRLVGEERLDLSDLDYRRFIRARILVNRCNGTVDELLTIWAMITGPDNLYRLSPMYPAGYTLTVVRTTFLSEAMRRRVRRMMEDAKPAGVTTEYVEALYGYFGFVGAMGGLPPGYPIGVGLMSRIL